MMFLKASSPRRWVRQGKSNSIDSYHKKGGHSLTLMHLFMCLSSIGQVHKAKLKSEFSNIGGYGGGDSVAVKVMHRGAEDRFHHDFQVFRWLCRVALKGWEPILDECYRQIMSEFDYRREAKCLSLVRQNMAKSPFKRKIRIPEPVTKLCSKELLVMQMLEGKKLSDAIEDELALALGGKDKAEAMIKKKRLGKPQMHAAGALIL